MAPRQRATREEAHDYGNEGAHDHAEGEEHDCGDRDAGRGTSPTCGGPCAGERRRQGRLRPLAGSGLPLVGPGAGVGRAGGDMGAFIEKANPCPTKKDSLN